MPCGADSSHGNASRVLGYIILKGSKMGPGEYKSYYITQQIRDITLFARIGLPGCVKQIKGVQQGV